MFLKKKLKGVTMVELLVSLNIIAFGIFMMAIVMIMLLRSGQTNIDNSSAYIVADSVMKTYISQHKQSTEELLHGDRTGTTNAAGAYEETHTFDFSGKQFHYTITAQQVDGTADMVYLTAKVTEISTTADAGQEGSTGANSKHAVISTLISPRTGIN